MMTIFARRLLFRHSCSILKILGWNVLLQASTVHAGWLTASPRPRPVVADSSTQYSSHCHHHHRTRSLRRNHHHHPDDRGNYEQCPENLRTLDAWDRRDFIQKTTALSSAATIAALVTPTTAPAAAFAPLEPPQQRPRLVDVGVGGVDISIDTRTKTLSDPPNLVFPASLQGRWSCQRTCLSVDGDIYQAQSAWKAMGGGARGSTSNSNNQFGPKEAPERHEVQFIPAPFQPDKYTVLDRSYELTSRTTSGVVDNNKKVTVTWNAKEPDIALMGNTQLAVIQRSVISPNLDQGIVGGGQELVRISDGPFTRAVLVKQRFRPATTVSNVDTQTSSSSIDVLEGLELVKTFRVLDGIAGTEFPTSMTKYLLRLERIGPVVVDGGGDDDATLVSSSTSSLYFDGSAWY